ncbi:MAG: SLC13 family permease [Rhodospirillum sp.]|nr:SLC13 family permease [Rhodospirillum sp.]MCF8489499.1 SLC13 family permease [Rhodospirillum sp.]
MTADQILSIGLLGGTLLVLASDRWRPDLVAVLALLAAVGLGLVPGDRAFTGLSNPAVVTVAAVLVLGRTLVAQGVLSLVPRFTRSAEGVSTSSMAVLCGSAALLSSVMNNVGALALMLPLALAVARESGISASRILMPLSFSTLLGGMVTLIGTPPNLIISQIREAHGGAPFAIFDFLPVGLPLALVGVASLIFASRRLLPDRLGDGDGTYALGKYQAELVVRVGSRLVGVSVDGAEVLLDGRIHGVMRDGRFVFARRAEQVLASGDLVRLEVDDHRLQDLLAEDLFELPGGPPLADGWDLRDLLVTPGSVALGSTLSTLEPWERWGIRAIAAARGGRRFEGRLSEETLIAGDVILMAGRAEDLDQAASDLDCLPLRDRGMTLRPRRALLAGLIFGAAITVAAMGWAPPEVSFVAAVAVLALVGLLSPADIYRRIDWMVVVFLAALIPVGETLERTGAASVIAAWVLGFAGDAAPHALLGLTLVLGAALTPVLNNVATVLILAPVVLGIAEGAGLNGDPLLMALTIAASADFLTPFGHHNNTLILGPGHYRFLDYPRLGLPLVCLVLGAAYLLIPLVWPLGP